MTQANTAHPPVTKGRSNALKLSILIVLVVLFFTVPLAFYPWVTTFTVTKDTVAQLLLLVIAVLWSLLLLKSGDRFSLKSPLTIPIIVLAGIIALSLINSEDFFSSFLGLALWGSYFLLYFVVISMVGNLRSTKVLLGAALSAGFLASTYCIFQFYGVDFSFWAKLGGRGRLFSTFGNPNYLAGYLIACMPPAFVLLTTIRRRWQKGVLLTAITILYTSLLMTYTRAAWAGFIASALFTLIAVFFSQGKHLFRRNRYWLAGLAVAIVAITVIYSVPNPLNWEGRSVVGRAASSFDLTSYASRSLIWLSTIEVAKEHPIIGQGIGTLGVNYPEAQGDVLKQARYEHLIPQANYSINAHNDVLHMWAEIGILGLLAAAWIVLAFYRRSLLSLKKMSTDQAPLLIGFMGGALAILAHSVFSFPFHVIQNGLVFWLFLGLSWVTIRQSRVETDESSVWSLESRVQNLTAINDELRTTNQQPRTKNQHLLLRWAIVIIVIGAVVFLGMARAQLFRADMYTKKGKDLIQAGLGGTAEAISALETAVRLEPAYGRAYVYLGMAYDVARRYDQAASAFEQAKKNWIEIDVYNLLGQAYKNAGLIDKAEQALHRSIYLFPNYYAAYLNLSELCRFQAEECLSNDRFEAAASHLDTSFFYLEQAKIFNAETKVPPGLVSDYYKLGLQATGLIPQPPPCSFFSPDEEPILDLLGPLAQPDKPILFKLFFYAKDEEFSEGVIDILADSGKTIETVPLTGRGPILTGYSVNGLAAGEYELVARVAYGDKSVQQNCEFTVVEPLLEIAKFSANIASVEEPTTIYLIVRNNKASPALIVGTIKIADGSGKEVGEIRFPPTYILPNGEKGVELGWDQGVQPGLYSAAARILAAGSGNTVTGECSRMPAANAETFFIVPRS